MSNIRFSIVIPTRERPETLDYTLRTCLAQQHSNYEIIVCDNCSAPATQLVVERWASDKIKYIRSDRPLAMSDNWELAVSQATGEYVIVIGDDDGLLLHTLAELERLLAQIRSPRAIRWERAYYSWPNHPLLEEANLLHLPLEQASTLLSGRGTIRSAANFELDYTMLPMLYNSAIHADLIGALRRKTGRVFAAQSPDIYSGFAFAHLAGEYVSVGIPMSINAGSASSNGVANISLSGASPVAQEFRRLNTGGGLSWHATVPDVPSLSAAVGDAFQHAKDRLFLRDTHLSLNRKTLLANSLLTLQPRTEAERQSYLQALRQSVQDDAALQRWFDHAAQGFVLRTKTEARPRPRLGFDGTTLHIDASKFGVSDVYGVAELVENLLGFSERTTPVLADRVTGRFGWRSALRVARRLIKTARRRMRAAFIS